MTNQQLKAHCEDVIAITDEKRRTLIEDIESRIGISEGIIATQKNIQNHPDYEGLCDGLLLDRIALAALKAEPAAKRDSTQIGGLTMFPFEVAIDHADGTLYYTAPPVPELKINRIKKLAAEIVENLVDCSGADEAAVEQYTAWVVKRLNGVKS